MNDSTGISYAIRHIIKRASETSDTDADAARNFGIPSDEFAYIRRRLGIETPDKQRERR